MSSDAPKGAPVEGAAWRRASAEGIFGTVLTGSIVAAEGAAGAAETPIVGAVVVSLVVFWLAHVYATLMSRHVETRRSITMGDARVAAREMLPILEAGLIPVLALIVVRAAGASVQTAVVAALACSIVELLVIGLVLARHSGFRGWQLLFYGVACGLLGVGLILLETLLRH
jgi:hypothetical protein